MWNRTSGIDYDVLCEIGSPTDVEYYSPTGAKASCIGLPTPRQSYKISVVSLSYDQRSEISSINITARMYWCVLYICM